MGSWNIEQLIISLLLFDSTRYRSSESTGKVRSSQHGRNAKWMYTLHPATSSGEKSNSIYRDSPFLLNRFDHDFFRWRYSQRVIAFVTLILLSGNCSVWCFFRQRWLLICWRQRRRWWWKIVRRRWRRRIPAFRWREIVVIILAIGYWAGDIFAQVQSLIYSLVIDFAIIQRVDGVLTTICIVHCRGRSKKISWRQWEVFWGSWCYLRVYFQDAWVEVSEKARLWAWVAQGRNCGRGQWFWRCKISGDLSQTIGVTCRIFSSDQE